MMSGEEDSSAETMSLGNEKGKGGISPKITRKDMLIFIVVLVECLFFGGTLYGWPSLEYVYKDIGVYSETCIINQTRNATETTEECSDDSGKFTIAFNVGLASFNLFSILAGWLLDRFGLRPVRLVAIFAGVVGTLCLAFASKEYPYLIFPGTIFVGAACGSMLLLTNYLAQGMKKYAAATILIYNGVYNSSGITYFIVKVAYDNGFSQRWTLIIIACSWTLVLLTTFLLLPASKINQAAKVLDEGPEKPHQDSTSAWLYIKDVRYICHILYTVINYIWLGLVLGTMNLWLTDIYNGDQVQVSHYVNTYAYVQFTSGILLCPFTGALTHLVRKYLEGIEGGILEPDASAVIPVPGLLLSSCSYIIVGIALLTAQTGTVYLLFIFNEVGRGFFFGSMVAYVALVFPIDHFGVLVGFLNCFTAATLAIQYGYVCWTTVNGLDPAVGLTLGLTVISLLHPSFIVIRFIRKRRQVVLLPSTTVTEPMLQQQ